jgi:hypothetical protein
MRGKGDLTEVTEQRAYAIEGKPDKPGIEASPLASSVLIIARRIAFHPFCSH